jgi:hypothetical protein
MLDLKISGILIGEDSVVKIYEINGLSKNYMVSFNKKDPGYFLFYYSSI